MGCDVSLFCEYYNYEKAIECFSCADANFERMRQPGVLQDSKGKEETKIL